MGKRALVCEDDSAIRTLLCKLLTRHNLLADCVGSGDEALDQLRAHPYDVVVLDLLTPGLSGYEVVQAIEHELPHLLERVIVLTAVQRAFKEGLPVAAMVRKPFDLEEFDRVIHRVLFGRQEPPHGGTTLAQGELQ
jgi:DNA-binding response OmpR family regulator